MKDMDEIDFKLQLLIGLKMDLVITIFYHNNKLIILFIAIYFDTNNIIKNSNKNYNIV